jgi:peroxiredoxin family protein
VSTQDQPKICIILFSGDMDKALSALAMAWTAAGQGYQASIFFTFWGMSLLRKKRGAAQNSLEKLFKLLLPVGPERLGLSKMNFAGIGGFFMKKLIRLRGNETVSEMLALTMERKVNFIACQGTLEMLGIKESELIEYEQLTIGDVVTFLNLAEKSQIQLFI